MPEQLFMYNGTKAKGALTLIKDGKLTVEVQKVSEQEFKEDYPLAAGDIALKLEDGTILQSLYAIHAHLGKSIFPKDPKLQLKHDEGYELVRNLRSLTMKKNHAQGLKELENLMDGDGFAVGKSVTPLDYHVNETIGWVQTRAKDLDLSKEYPKIAKSVAAGEKK